MFEENASIQTCSNCCKQKEIKFNMFTTWYCDNCGRTNLMTNRLGNEMTTDVKQAEADPSGLGQHQPGAKLDAGKTRVHLMLSGFSRAIHKVAEVTTYGANKYTPNGWASVQDGIFRYKDAAGRHQLKEYIEEIDKESGLDHEAQVIWNLLAAYELKLRERAKQNDLVIAHLQSLESLI